MLRFTKLLEIRMHGEFEANSYLVKLYEIMKFVNHVVE
jgi:hypothetical protein